jgi:hypothetical protein
MLRNIQWRKIQSIEFGPAHENVKEEYLEAEREKRAARTNSTPAAAPSSAPTTAPSSALALMAKLRRSESLKYRHMKAKRASLANGVRDSAKDDLAAAKASLPSKWFTPAAIEEQGSRQKGSRQKEEEYIEEEYHTAFMRGALDTSTYSPTSNPTLAPTNAPTNAPSTLPSTSPSSAPSGSPTSLPPVYVYQVCYQTKYSSTLFNQNWGLKLLGESTFYRGYHMVQFPQTTNYVNISVRNC